MENQCSNKAKSIDELFAAACDFKDEEKRWEAVSALHSCGGEKAFCRCLELLENNNIQNRIAAVDVLAQLYSSRSFIQSDSPEIIRYKRLHPRKTVDILLDLLQTTVDDDLLESVCSAFCHNKSHRAIAPLVALKDHPNPDVRYAMCLALSGYEDIRAVKTLIELSNDEDDDIRNWATFELAQQIDINTKYIRKALWQRVDDHHNETRAEAILGLARRQVTAITEPLALELQKCLDNGECWDQIVEAAFSMPNPAYYKLLVAIAENFDNIWSLDEAIAACRIPSLDEDEVPDDLPTSCYVCGLRNAFVDSALYVVCKRCGWINDKEQRSDPELVTWHNPRSLNQERKRWRERLDMAAALDTSKI